MSYFLKTADVQRFEFHRSSLIFNARDVGEVVLFFSRW